MTGRLYYHDCYLRDFQAQVVENSADGLRVYLDRTAFYPTSGGQPFDTGRLGGAAVLEVVDEGERVAHLVDKPLPAGPVEGHIDWPRRYDHMQQHTGQHLLSAVLVELYGIPTVGFHLGAAASTIDVDAASLDAGRLENAEQRCAQIVAEARPVVISFEDASGNLELRKPSERAGRLRILTIQGIDRSACGGTHVRSTAEIGPILIRRLEKIRGNLRLEFVCGMRAFEAARSDFRLLSELSRTLSAPFESLPSLVARQVERVATLEKTTQRLASELARRLGRELYLNTAPDAAGVRRVTERGAIDDAMRARAQAFVAGQKAVFLAISEDPPSLLLAASADSELDAGARLKEALAAAGGRGGGSRTLAQGSLPSLDALNTVIQHL